MPTTLLQQLTALGDKTRYAIVVSMTKSEDLCVTELAERLRITPAAISQHMKILEQAGIVAPARDGRRVCYQLDANLPRVRALTTLIHQEEHQ